METQIWRDRLGIPHIRGGDPASVWRALGITHARDRLFQMDWRRRKAYGRQAEWLGPGHLDADRLARRLGGERLARSNFDACGAEARQMLESYAAGVNAEITRLVDARDLPLEYRLLQGEPAPWNPWDSIAVMRDIGLAMGSVWMKLFRAAALPALGPEKVALLRHDDGGEDCLVLPPRQDSQRWPAELWELAPAARALLSLADGDTLGGGSNNWALSGSRTATGAPILMGDPHRELDALGLYSQAHLACPEFDVIGLTVPGVPGFPHVGHNRDVAWGVTHAMADVQDLFIQRFRDEGREYLHCGTWKPADRRTETIAIRGQPPMQCEIVATIHGPIICGDPATGPALAFASPQLDPREHSFDCLPRMLSATSVPQFYEACRGWSLIDHNLVVADKAGRIGHRVRATLPRRPRYNGWLPVPGWSGAYDWQGTIAFEDMPAAIDPDGGRIVTANNRVVADDHPYYFCVDAAPPYRARRIWHLLDTLERPDIAAMQPIAMDMVSAGARIFCDHLATHEGRSPETSALASRLAAWPATMTADAVEPTLYARFRLALAKALVTSAGLSEPAGPAAALIGNAGMLNQMWWVLPGLLRTRNTQLLGAATWADLTETALEAVVDEGAPPPWSDAHRAHPVHPLAKLFPDSADRLNPSMPPLGGDNDTVCATGMVPALGLGTAYGAVARYGFDLSDWSKCVWTVYLGSSDRPESPHRQDQAEAWAMGATAPMLYDWQEIERTGRRER